MSSASLLCIVLGLEFYVGLALILMARFCPELLGENPWSYLYWFLPPLLLDKRSRPYIAGFLLFLLMYTHGRFIRLEWLSYLLVLIIPAVLIGRYRKNLPDCAARNPTTELLKPALVMLAFAVLYVFSSPVLHSWFYYVGWRPVIGEPILNSGLLRFVILTALLALAVLLMKRRSIGILLGCILAFSMIASFYFLIKITGGAPLYRDDHPSFMFRLWQFGKTFPQLENYSPYWNGGVVESVEISSGVCSMGIPFWPLWHWLRIETSYTWVVGTTYIIIMPLIAVASLRIAGGGWISAASAGILAMGVSRHFFLWMLHFGTIGAAFATSFVLPVSACLFRILWLRKPSPWVYAVLIVSGFFLVQWPPGAIMGAAISVGLLTSWRKWTVKKIGWLILCAIVVAALEAKSLLTLLHLEKGLAGFAESRRAVGADFLEKLIQGWRLLLDHIHEGHPILIFLGLAGVFFVPQRSVRLWCAPGIIALALITGWGPQWKPGLQLERMSIPMFFAAVIPASLLVENILKRDKCRLAIPGAALVALLLLGGWNVARLYRNEGAAQYVTPNSHVESVVKWIKGNTAPDSRILFAGPTVHGYGGGHVASLPMFTGREMMACDYYHFPVGSVEYDYPPAFSRETDEKIHRFMEMYNVSAVMASRGSWIRYFKSKPESYEEAGAIDNKYIFRVKRDPAASSLFVKGSGVVKADFNRIAVTVDDPSQEVVLKYNWAKGFQTTPPVEIYPYDARLGPVALIRVKPNGVKTFEITFSSKPWR